MINNEPTKPDDCAYCRGLCCGDVEDDTDCDLCMCHCTCGEMTDMYPDCDEYEPDDM